MARTWRCRATLWLLVLTAPLLAQEAAPTAAFAGSVRDALTGQPLAHAAVRLLPSGNGSGYQATTDASGHFRFNVLPLLQFRFETTRSGYEDSHLAVLKESAPAASIVQLTRGDSVADVRIALQPEGAITGRITDTDGSPLAGAAVHAIGVRWNRGVRQYESFASALADAAGQYRLRVSSGSYRIQARGPRNDGPVPVVFATEPGGQEMKLGTVVYPGSKEIEGGALLQIHPGQQLTGIDLKLPLVPCYRVRGVARGVGSHTALTLVSAHEGWSLFSNAGAVTGEDGLFDIEGVPSGRYSLEFFPFGKTYGAVPIEVKDRDLNGVVISASPRIDVKGRIRVDDLGPEFPARIEFKALEPELYDPGDRSTLKDGAFTVHLLPPQLYAVVIMNPAFYVKSVSADGRELPGGIVDLTHGTPGEIEVVAGRAAAQIEGRLRLLSETAIPDATAVLVSADARTGNTGARSSALDAAGRFQFTTVPPGRWYVFAVPRYDEGLWQNMDFVSAMASEGAAVTISDKGSAHVEVSLVSADDVHRVAEGVSR
jgi:hypothetical protein